MRYIYIYIYTISYVCIYIYIDICIIVLCNIYIYISIIDKPFYLLTPMWLAETSSHLKSRLEDFDRPRIGWFIAGKSPIKIQDPGICSICMDHMDMFNVCHVPKYQTVKTMLFCRKTPDSEKFNLLDPRLKVQCIYIILYIYIYTCLESSGVENLLHHDGEAILGYLGQCGNQTQ